LTVPATTNHENTASIVRMGSIPHGTTILAQSPSPPKGPGKHGGIPGPPPFDQDFLKIDTTPFPIGNFGFKIKFPSQDATRKDTARLPQDLSKFNEKGGTGTITTDIMKNPNFVLKKALEGLNVTETIVFEVLTGDPEPPNGGVQAATFTGPPAPKLNGGGTANMSFLVGTQSLVSTASPDPGSGTPNAHAASMKSTFWIETVAYKIIVPAFTKRDPVLLRPTMPKDSTAPTPVFLITPPSKLPSKSQTITVPGTQIQYSQNVSLNFATLTWPHLSVATLVPTEPQHFTMP